MLENVLLAPSTPGGRLRSGSRHRRQGNPVPGLALDRDRGHVLQESPVTQFQLVVVDGPSPVEDVHQAAAVVAKSEKGGPSLRERDIGELEAGGGRDRAVRSDEGGACRAIPADGTGLARPDLTAQRAPSQ